MPEKPRGTNADALRSCSAVDKEFAYVVLQTGMDLNIGSITPSNKMTRYCHQLKQLQLDFEKFGTPGQVTTYFPELGLSLLTTDSFAMQPNKTNALYKDFIILKDGKVFCHFYFDHAGAPCLSILSTMEQKLKQKLSLPTENGLYHFEWKDGRFVFNMSMPATILSKGIKPTLEPQFIELEKQVNEGVVLCSTLNNGIKSKRSIYSWLNLETYQHGSMVDEKIALEESNLKKLSVMFNQSVTNIKKLWSNELGLMSNLKSLQAQVKTSNLISKDLSQKLENYIINQMMTLTTEQVRENNHLIEVEVNAVKYGQKIFVTQYSLQTLKPNCYLNEKFMFYQPFNMVADDQAIFTRPTGCQAMILKASTEAVPLNSIFKICKPSCPSDNSILKRKNDLLLSNVTGQFICPNGNKTIQCSGLGKVQFPSSDCFFTSDGMFVFQSQHFHQQTTVNLANLNFSWKPSTEMENAERPLGPLQTVEQNNLQLHEVIIQNHYQWLPYALIGIITMIFMFSCLVIARRKYGCPQVKSLCCTSKGFSLITSNPSIYLDGPRATHFPEGYSFFEGAYHRTSDLPLDIQPPKHLINRLKKLNETPERNARVVFERGQFRFLNSNYFYSVKDECWKAPASEKTVYGLPLAWRQRQILA